MLSSWSCHNHSKWASANHNPHFNMLLTCLSCYVVVFAFDRRFCTRESIFHAHPVIPSRFTLSAPNCQKFEARLTLLRGIESKGPLSIARRPQRRQPFLGVAVCPARQLF